MAKLNVLMLNYEFPPIGGGAGNAHLYLLEEYAKNNELTIDVLTSAPKPGFTHEQFAENITIYKVGLHKKKLHYWRKTEVLEWLFKAKSHYRKLLQQNNYDLAHAFFAFPTGWLCYRTADRLPYIVSLRGSDVPGYNVRLGLDYKLMAGIFRNVWSSAAEVVARARAECAESEPAVVPGKKPVRGRPRLGVEAKEVALLPKHWAWLQSRPKSASATLRLLVEEKMKASTRATRRSECARANHAWTLG